MLNAVLEHKDSSVKKIMTTYLIDSSAVFQDSDILKDLIEEKEEYFDEHIEIFILSSSIDKLQNFVRNRNNSDVADNIAGFLENLYDHYEKGNVFIKSGLNSVESLSVICDFIDKFDNKDANLTVATCDPTVLSHIDSLSEKGINNIHCYIPRKIKTFLTDEEAFGYGTVAVCDGSVYDRIAATADDESDKVYVTDIREFDNCVVHPNRFFVVTDGASRSILVRVCKDRNGLLLKRIDPSISAFGTSPRNAEQQFCFNLLLDPDIQLVSLIGPAGTGKTYICTACGLSQLKNKYKPTENTTSSEDIEGGYSSKKKRGGTSKRSAEEYSMIDEFSSGLSKRYEKLLIVRPVISVGKEIGFLPGTLEEKMDPWLDPIKDNIKNLLKKNKIRNKTPDDMLRNGEIEVEALAYIRGRSIENTYIIVDEAQNMSYHELKTVITRAGKGTKIVLTGDLDQVDLNLLRGQRSGLDLVIKKMINYSLTGHIKMCKVERSDLASAAVEAL